MHCFIILKDYILFQGGSKGKKTDVLDQSDVDLVMYVNDYTTMTEFQQHLEDDLKHLERHIKGDLNWAEEVEVIDRTHHAVQFEVKLKGYHHPINVDLLPAIDISKGNGRLIHLCVCAFVCFPVYSCVCVCVCVTLITNKCTKSHVPMYI